MLQDYSRSNSILIDIQTQEHKLPPALVGVKDTAHQIRENAAIVFLHHPKAKNDQLSPRLSRLVAATLQYPDLQIRLVPVSILWGRAPDKEDSLFKLLAADNWEDPSITKQLFNIGVMGRDTFVQFHPAQDLRSIIYKSLHDSTDEPVALHRINGSDNSLDNIDNLDSTDSSAVLGNLQDNSNQDSVKQNINNALVPSADANRDLVHTLQQQLNIYLDKQRASMLGPDLSDRRNLVDKLIYSPAIKHAIESEAKATGNSAREARALAKGYANEMVNNYSHPIIRVFDRF